jgi:transcriptional regulator of acetoin/glycerol metabolism
MFDERTIREIVDEAERDGCGQGLAMKLEADLLNTLAQHRRRIERNRRHERVLSVVGLCGFDVRAASEVLDVSREAVYKHLRKKVNQDS